MVSLVYILYDLLLEESKQFLELLLREGSGIYSYYSTSNL
jgi:hypothetical protein